MTGQFFLSNDNLSRAQKFREFIPQWRSLLYNERNEVACLSMTASALYETFGFHWVGFYRVDFNDLVIGPFQGPIPCIRIQKGKGVCGTVWLNKKSICVPDVEKFPGHIACSSLTKSELVIPIIDKIGDVKAVLDIDSSEINDFSTDDLNSLEFICRELEKQIYH